MKINIYTDGAYSSSSEVGGWALVAVSETDLKNSHSEFNYQTSGYESNTTNNRMELYALLMALYLVYDLEHDRSPIYRHITATIYTDSAYIANCFKDKWYEKWQLNGWKTSKRTPVLNQDLWEKILYCYGLLKTVVTIQKVEGHSGNQWNELADQLAVKARTLGAEKEKINEENN